MMYFSCVCVFVRNSKSRESSRDCCNTVWAWCRAYCTYKSGFIPTAAVNAHSNLNYMMRLRRSINLSMSVTWVNRNPIVIVWFADCQFVFSITQSKTIWDWVSFLDWSISKKFTQSQFSVILSVNLIFFTIDNSKKLTQSQIFLDWHSDWQTIEIELRSVLAMSFSIVDQI